MFRKLRNKETTKKRPKTSKYRPTRVQDHHIYYFQISVIIPPLGKRFKPTCLRCV